MTGRTIWIAIIASVLSFVGGFMLANTLNRNQPAPGEAPKAAQNPNSPASSELSLTNEEIQRKVEEADKNPGNFTFQKNLGLSLYRYAALKQDANLLPDALRIMERALALEPTDRDLQIGIGNGYFDKGYFNKDNEGYVKAREYYRKALEKMSTDTDVRVDLALSYFLIDPPDYATAAAEFEKGLEANSKHERALQFLTQTYISQNQIDKAAATLERLKQAHPSSASIPELSTMLANAGTRAPK